MHGLCKGRRVLLRVGLVFSCSGEFSIKVIGGRMLGKEGILICTVSTDWLDISSQSPEVSKAEPRKNLRTKKQKLVR